MYKLEGEREFCHFSSLSVETTSCSSFLLSEFHFVWWEKVVIDPECDLLILTKILVKKKRGQKKKKNPNDRGLFLLKLNAPTLYSNVKKC